VNFTFDISKFIYFRNSISKVLKGRKFWYWFAWD